MNALKVRMLGADCIYILSMYVCMFVCMSPLSLFFSSFFVERVITNMDLLTAGTHDLPLLMNTLDSLKRGYTFFVGGDY